ncbi:putative gibberellin 3-beta-dioxygenase 3-like, partial [Capsicum annuum]
VQEIRDGQKRFAARLLLLRALGQGPQAGSSTGPQGHYAPAIAGGIAQPRPTQPLPVESIPDMLVGEYEDDETMKLRIERAARAGGWSSEISRKRALEEAYGSESCKDTFPRLSFSFVTFCGFWKNSEKFIQVPSMEQHLSICHHDGFCS